MRVYSAYRNWVDGLIRDSAIRAPAPILLVAVIPVTVLLFFEKRPAAPVFLVLIWAAVVIGWGAWRYWRVLSVEATRADEHFDREGKYRLRKEYHSTVSATKAKEAKDG